MDHRKNTDSPSQYRIAHKIREISTQNIGFNQSMNNLSDSQENQTVILDDVQPKLDSTQYKNPSDEDSILLKYYKVEKKAHDQMCLLINNNWWYSWAYKKTKNIVNNIVIDLTTT
ncbi:hypothetical protein C1646_769200 [Rhizophagus diaphanus]|nr:hypothetical protein C1646_769200 [Rhizophagus diaphanus] [Rhizophagus sp. MUCL 43196]